MLKKKYRKRIRKLIIMSKEYNKYKNISNRDLHSAKVFLNKHAHVHTRTKPNDNPMSFFVWLLAKDLPHIKEES